MGRRQGGKVGIALAGGGPLGGIYEIGALTALDEALVGLRATECDVYVGVSSGAFVAACLANGLSPREMHAMFILDASHSDPFEPELLLRPAFAEFAARLVRLPGLARSAALAWLDQPPPRGFVESFLRLTRGLPSGLFDNAPIAAYLKRLFSRPGRSDDFRALKRQLIIVATDLDSGQSAPFGAAGYDDTPISEAVKASAALPGLYPPARIGGRDYVDGVLKKTLHASQALKAGAKLLICVNPLAPFDAQTANAVSGGRFGRLAERGLMTVLSQTFRVLIRSRLAVGMERYAREFPDADVVLFEPSPTDEVMFLANMFSYSERRRLAEHAYRHMRAELRRRADELRPILARHGVGLDEAGLADPDRRLPRRGPRGGPLQESLAPLEGALDEMEATLGRMKRAPSRGVKRHDAKAAATHA